MNSLRKIFACLWLCLGISAAPSAQAQTTTYTKLASLPNIDGGLRSGWLSQENVLFKEIQGGDLIGVFSGSTQAHLAVSQDDGQTWRVVNPTPSFTLPNGPVSVCQSPDGQVHLLYPSIASGGLSYARLVLVHDRAGHVINFSSDLPLRPGFTFPEIPMPATNGNMNIRAQITAGVDSSGAPTLFWTMYDDPGTGDRARIQAGKTTLAAGTNPTSSADFIALNDQAGVSLLYHTANQSSSSHNTGIHLAQHPGSKDLWFEWGPINTGDSTTNPANEPVRRLRATPNGAHSWQIQPAVVVEGFNTSLNFSPIIGAVARNSNFVYFSRVSASRGIVIDRIDANGNVTPDAFPSPFPNARSQADFALSVNEAGTEAWMGGWICADSGTEANAVFAMHWDGSKWTRFNDTPLGDTAGVGQSVGWNNGVVLVIPEWDTWLVSLATLRTAKNTDGPAPVISNFSASPSTLSAGASTTLTWTTTGATALSIDQGIGTVSGTSITATPASTRTYTLTATNAAGSTTAQVVVTVNPPPAKPVIASFTATPAAITSGQTSTLGWSVTGATTLSINQGVGTVTGLSKSVSPTTTTIYTLTATNATGSTTAQVTVTVNPASALPTITSFTATPVQITTGQTATLNWNVTGATRVSINQGIGVVTGTTAKIVAPTKTTTYTLTARNAAGTKVATVTVTVGTVTTKPVITSFTATPATITVGQSSTLNWSVSGATSIAINQGIGAVTGSSTSVTPASTTTYTITATNAAGSVIATTAVTVNPLPMKPVITSFTATPAVLTTGQSSTLAWNVTGATALFIDQGVGAVTGTSVAVAPTNSTTYTLTATNAAGSVTAPALITVSGGGGSTTTPWVLGFAPTYFFGQGSYLNPEEIDYTTMTHFIFCFLNAGGYTGSQKALGELEGNPGTQRGLGGTPVSYTTKQGRTYPSVEDAYVGEAHRAGTKAMIVLGGSGNNSGILNACLDPALRAKLVKNLVDHLVLADYDGIDIDWENNLPDDYSLVVRFIDDLRADANSRPRFQAPNKPVIITLAGFGIYHSDGWAATNATSLSKMKLAIGHVDRINIQTYMLDGSGWWNTTWGIACLRNNANFNTHPTDIEFMLQSYVDAGFPREQLNFGIGLNPAIFYSYTPWEPGKEYQLNEKAVSGYAVYQVRQAGTSGLASAPSGFGSDLPDGTVVWSYVGHMGPEQPTTTASSITDGDWNSPTNGAFYPSRLEGTAFYDADAGNSYLVFANDPQRRGYCTWEDDRSIADKAQWMRRQGYGGVIVWMTSYGNTSNNSNNNPFMDSIKKNYFGPMPIAIRLQPNPVSLTVGQTQAFAVRELTGTTNTAVTWSVVEPDGGSISSSGLYTAPAKSGLYHVRVTSSADPSKFADAAVTVDGFRIQISPDTARVPMGQTHTFVPQYVNGTDPLGVTWTVVETGGGTITSTGGYTAPATPGIYHVRATSRSQPSVRGLAEVNVPAPVSVLISPANATVQTGGRLDLWPTVKGEGVSVYNDDVTWSVVEASAGTVDSLGSYTAPTTPGTYHLRATSTLDPTKFAMAQVQVIATAPAIFRKFQQLPPQNQTTPKLLSAAGEPRLMKDRSPGSAGELFGFVTNPNLILLKSGDQGATWSYVTPTASNTIDGVLAITQDSRGKVHVISRSGGELRYARFLLAHSGGAITGFSAEVQNVLLPGAINAFIQVHGMMQSVIDGAGAERLLYQFSSYENESDARFCLRMGSASSMDPITTADFTGLDGGPALTTLFQTAVYGIGGHSALFAQLGATREVWVVFGPTPEYGAFTDSTFNMRQRLTPKADHTWSVSKPVAIDAAGANTRPCLFSLVGTQNYVWFMRSEPEKGICIDRIDAAGIYQKDVVPSPEAQTERAGFGVMSVSTDEKQISAIWTSGSRYDGGGFPVTEKVTTLGFWNGSAWAIARDALTGVKDKTNLGLYGTTGWANGVTALYVNSSDISLAVATVQAPN